MVTFAAMTGTGLNCFVIASYHMYDFCLSNAVTAVSYVDCLVAAGLAGQSVVWADDHTSQPMLNKQKTTLKHQRPSNRAAKEKLLHACIQKILEKRKIAAKKYDAHPERYLSHVLSLLLL